MLRLNTDFCLRSSPALALDTNFMLLCAISIFLTWLRKLLSINPFSSSVRSLSWFLRVLVTIHLSQHICALQRIFSFFFRLFVFGPTISLDWTSVSLLGLALRAVLPHLATAQLPPSNWVMSPVVPFGFLDRIDCVTIEGVGLELSFLSYFLNRDLLSSSLIGIWYDCMIKVIFSFLAIMREPHLRARTGGF